MRYRFFKVNVNYPEEGEQALNQCLASEAVLGVERQFVSDGPNSHWAVCVTVAPASKPSARGGKRARIDYRELLPPGEFAKYARLRELRNGLAQQQDIPAYAIFSNEQLAAMARLEEPSREALAAIEGIGEKRLAQYAPAFLDALLQAASPNPDGSSNAAEAPDDG